MMNKLEGLTTALVTPLNARGKLDEPALNRLIEHVVGSGVNNLFVLGAAGEFAALDMDTKRRLVEIAHRQLKGRVPLIVGVTADSTSLVFENIMSYARGKADFALCTPPNFLPLSQDECREFYLAVAEKSPVPVIIYNCPLNKNYLEPKTVVELAGHRNVAALKETSDMTKLIKMWAVLSERKDFILMSGWEYLYLPALSIGVRAFIMGGPGNMFPGECAALLSDYQQGRHEQARARFRQMIDFMEKLYSLPCGPMPAVKGVLEALGLCKRYMAHPTTTASDEQMR